MHRVTILYPNGKDATFDFDYYKTKHMPMIAGKAGKAVERFEIAKSIGGLGGADAPYIAIGSLYVKDLEGFQKALADHGAEIMGDIPNYTNTQPAIEIDEIV